MSNVTQSTSTPRSTPPPLVLDEDAIRLHQSVFGPRPIEQRAFPLPEEAILHTLGYLNERELATCSLVCRHLEMLSQDDSLWKNLFRATLSNEPFPTLAEGEVWKNAHRKRLQMRKNLSKGEYHLHCLREHTMHVSSQVIYKGLLISGSFDSTIKIWDLQSRECKNTLEGHTSRVNCLVLHGDQLISGSGDKTIKIWDLKTNECKYTLTGLEHEISSFIIANGLLYAGDLDGKIKIWDLKTNTCTATLEGEHKDEVSSLLVVDGMLISSSFDETIKMWDLKTNTCIGTLNGHTGLITSLVSAGQMLISCSYDCTIKIWDFKEKKCIDTLQITGLPCCLALFDGKLFVGGVGRNVDGESLGEITLWDLQTKKCIYAFETGSPVNSVLFANGMLFSGTSSGKTLIHDFNPQSSQLEKKE